ncbi:uncharacterized protein METZ01_LOCUS467421, partial [marine metagenome]
MSIKSKPTLYRLDWLMLRINDDGKIWLRGSS